MRKLYRNSPSFIGGVCSGLGEHFKVDDIIIRAIFAILIFTPFPVIILYLLLWISVPLKPENQL
jgi:phage shock protein C